MLSWRGFTFVLALVLLIGLLPVSAQEIDEADINRALTIRWLQDVRTGGDFAAGAALFAALGFNHHSPNAITGQTVSLGDLVGSLVDMKTAFPDLAVTDYLVLAEGDMTAAIFFEQGTFNGPFGDVAPSGELLREPVMLFSRFDDGQIVADWWAWNTLGFDQVIGSADVQVDFALAPWDTWIVPTGDTPGMHRSTLRILYDALSVQYPDVMPACSEDRATVINPTSVEGYFDLLPTYYADNVVVHDYTRTLGGLNGLTEQMSAITSLPGFRTNCAQFVCEGNLCASWSVAQVNTDAGETPFVWAALHRFDGGKIAEEWWLYDRAVLLPLLNAS